MLTLRDKIEMAFELAGLLTVLIGGGALLMWPCWLWIEQLAKV